MLREGEEEGVEEEQNKRRSKTTIGRGGPPNFRLSEVRMRERHY